MSRCRIRSGGRMCHFLEESKIMAKILRLTLKKKWFDLIASGQKTHEYRQGKEYWRKRLLDKNRNAIEFDEVHFRNGYGPKVPFMRVEWKGLRNWVGSKNLYPHIFNHGEIVDFGDFDIRLGKVLEVTGWKPDPLLVYTEKVVEAGSVVIGQGPAWFVMRGESV